MLQTFPISSKKLSVVKDNGDAATRTFAERPIRLHRPVEKLNVFFVKGCPWWKRAMDIVLSTAAVLTLLPIMIPIAIAVKLTSKGPLIFKQKRVGLGGRTFNIYKFRSMVVDAEEQKELLMKLNERQGPVFKLKDDPRATRIGSIIRRWSLDELPQFFNVLFGHMSLVGPRPPIVEEVSYYENWQERRIEVKPGITCLWQVYARHDNDFDNWMRLDMEYIRNQSFWLDVKLLALTIPAVLSRKGAS
jgi:exopolysaccharide biosynthesis polyprenyl glycosylphosphotransferase